MTHLLRYAVIIGEEGVYFLLWAPAQHVTEAIHRILLVTAQANALFLEWWDPLNCDSFYFENHGEVHLTQLRMITIGLANKAPELTTFTASLGLGLTIKREQNEQNK